MTLESSASIENYEVGQQQSIIKNVNKVSKKKRNKKPKMTEKEMVHIFMNSNDHNTIAPLYNRYYYGLKKYVFGIIKDFEMADDVVVETFEKVWTSKHMFDAEKAQFSTWIYTIAKNICLGILYKKGKTNIVDNDISDLYDCTTFEFDGICEKAKDQFLVKENSVQVLSSEDIIKQLSDCSIREIKKLDDRTASILEDKLLNNKKIKDISEEYNMNMSTVKDILYKGKRILKEIMITKYKGLYEMYMDVIGEKSYLD